MLARAVAAVESKKIIRIAKVIEGFGMTGIPSHSAVPYDVPHQLAAMGKPGMEFQAK